MIAALIFANAFAFAPLQGQIAGAARHDIRRSEAAVVLDTAIAEAQKFLSYWQDVWRVSEGERHTVVHPMRFSPHRARYYFGMCAVSIAAVDANRIPSGQGRLLDLCPSWLLGETLGVDERNGIDAAIAPQYRDDVRSFRARLLSRLASAAAMLPGDNWIVGQRVRFTVDQGERDDALRIAQSCVAARAWCLDLEAFVRFEQNEFAAADSLFALARGLWPEQQRCADTSMALLVASDARIAYTSASCALRMEFTTRTWWLADPLYSDAGNERRAEHERRRVLAALRGALPRDERFEYRDRAGGAARREMLVRYGWPTLMYWNGYHSDNLQYRSESAGNQAAWIGWPRTTYEYGGVRLALLPSAAVLTEPFAASAAAFAVAGANRGPTESDSLELGEGLARVAAWPREHFQPSVSIRDLPEGQVALLRRDHGVILAAATAIDSQAVAMPAGAPIAAALVATPHPDTIAIVSRAEAIVGGTVVVWAEMPARRVVAGIETLPSAIGARARNRFGVVPPAALEALAPGEVAISDPILLDDRPQSSELSSVLADALGRMAASTRVAGARAVGLYWETYGLQQTDTVSFTVRVRRTTRQGVLRRAAIALNTAQDLNVPVSVSWMEPAAGRGSRQIASGVPIVARVLTLDVSGLVAGDYELEIVAEPAGRPQVTGYRAFSMR